MTLDVVRAALRSDERNVLIEAPAGCGKTFEAADLAVELGTQVPKGTEVLVLAHTNAAVQEFLRRVRNTNARVRATTVDSFCLELLTPYAVPLGLPFPLRRSVGLGVGRVGFELLAPNALDLLTRCPSIATVLAHRYPFVILDEHQDTNIAQHDLVSTFCRIAQCRVRIFGDPMQAIYEAQTAESVSWDRLSREAGVAVALDTPQRWRDEADLGEWILAARQQLRTGRPLPLRQAPPSVQVRRLPNLRCVGFGHGNAGVLTPPVQEFLTNSSGSVAVLSRHNNHVWGLHIAAGDRLRLNEGADYSEAYALLERATANIGNPQRLSMSMVEHLTHVSTGLDQAKQQALSRALQVNRIDYGRQRVLREFISYFEPLYRAPDLWTFCEIARHIASNPPQWLTIRMPATLRLLGQTRPRSEDDPLECLDQIIARIKAGARRPSRSASTIHKAKGLEFDHVLISNFSAAHFGDDEMSRRLAYVALSRARHSITVLVPGDSPSPLLG
jgi:UvrD-like helicase family protein